MTILRRLLLLLAPLLLLGCGDTESQGPGANTLIYCSEGVPEGLNPQLATTSTSLDVSSSQLYNRLLRYDELTRRLIPELATRWQVSADGRQYTFYLRAGIPFHSQPWFTPSRPLTAEDVQFSFDRLRLPEHPLHRVSGGVYPYFDSNGFRKLVEAIEVLTPQVVRFTLTRPDSDFLFQLASDFAVVLSAEYGTLRLQQGRPELVDVLPVGTGPFKYRSQEPDQWLRFERHPEYWQQPQTLDQVIFDITPNGSQRLAKLFSGDCDVAAQPLASELKPIIARETLSLQRAPGANVALLVFNTQRIPLDDLRVRQAMSLAIDRSKLLQAVYYGTAESAHRLLPQQAEPQPPALVNLSKARELLNQAGLQMGFSLDLWLSPVARIYNPNPMKMAELIQADLARIGIQVNIVIRSWPMLLTGIRQGSHDAVLLGWNADTPSPLHFMSSLFACRGIEAGTNSSHWCDDTFEQLIRDARHSISITQQEQLLQAAEDHLLQQLPAIPLARSQRLLAVHESVHGLRLPTIGAISFSGVYRD